MNENFADVAQDAFGILDETNLEWGGEYLLSKDK
jgi:hypothetical protein